MLINDVVMLTLAPAGREGGIFRPRGGSSARRPTPCRWWMWHGCGFSRV